MRREKSRSRRESPADAAMAADAEVAVAATVAGDADYAERRYQRVPRWSGWRWRKEMAEGEAGWRCRTGRRGRLGGARPRGARGKTLRIYGLLERIN